LERLREKEYLEEQEKEKKKKEVGTIMRIWLPESQA
jgi:hypothetical protein